MEEDVYKEGVYKEYRIPQGSTVVANIWHVTYYYLRVGAVHDIGIMQGYRP